MKTPLSVSIRTLVALLGTSAAVQAQTSYYYQAQTGPGGTWNLYEYMLGTSNFKDANASAVGIVNPFGGLSLGYLAEIGSAIENLAVNQMTYRGDAWIGLTDRAGIAPGATEGTFAWTNGAPVSYTNYNAGEPNNAGGEDAVHMTGSGLWNDNRSGYPAGDPDGDAGSTDESGGAIFRSIREWATASPTPLPGVRSASALSFAGTLPGPEPTPGNFGVREVRGLIMEGNIYDAVNKALSGQGTFTEGQVPRLDLADPESSGNGGPIIPGAAQPFLSNTVGTLDDNILSIVHGKVVVPSNGLWTIQVRSDDGFGLRVVGQNFASVNGGGQLDPLDASTMYFFGGTGDADTRGVINLNAGTYDIEFVHWEGTGGAYYEVTTAKGAVTSGGGAQFLAIGDTSVLPSTLSSLRMTANGTVKTVAEGGGLTANNIGEARTLLGTSAGNTGTFDVAQIGDGQPVPFPTGTPANEFATQLTGSFLLDNNNAIPGESITLTFAILSDDGSQLRIIGQDFDVVTDFTDDGAATLVEVSGDFSLTADYFTGNTNAFGRITLFEGTYNFEAIQFEGDGGADLEVLYSIGDKTGTGLDATFAPLSTATGFAANEGWAAVPEPGTGLLALIGASSFALRRRRRS